MPELLVAPPGPVEPMPGDIEPAPGDIEPVPGDMEPMPVALFMLLGPLAAEGEPAEFCMPVPLLAPMPDALPVVVAWDGLALAPLVPAVEVGEPWPPMPVEPVPMVWAKPAVALNARAAPAMKIIFMLVSTFQKTSHGDAPERDLERVNLLRLLEVALRRG